jgi:polysaccharide export outer membrane protein
MSRLLSIGILFLLFNTSCTSTKEIVYFNNAQDTTYTSGYRDKEVAIEPNDILSISITSLNSEASAVFNPVNNITNRTTTVNGTSTEAGGYLVDVDGTIQLPILGSIKAEGLTRKQLKDNITGIILSKKLLIDPIVTIRFLNFEVTVIGEVAHPTVITVPSEKISLLKALGIAGDLTIYGRRDNVLLIREENGIKKTRHINLNSSSFFKSPYYFLKPNDVIYVEPNKDKVASISRSRQLVPAILSGLSVAIIVLDRIFKRK